MKTFIRGLILSGIFYALASAGYGIQQLSAPRATPEGVFVAEATTMTVTTQVAVDGALIPSSVNLVSTYAGQTTVLSRMYDDGTHGDAVVGDGIFTAQVTINQPAVGTLGIVANAAYRGQRNRTSSPTTVLPVVRRPTAAELDIAANVPANGLDFFNTRRTQVGDQQARAELLASLANEPGVASVSTSPDGFYIGILFTSGLQSSIPTPPVGTKANITFVSSSQNAAVAPFFSSFSPFDETDNIATLLGNTCGGSPSVLKNSAGTVASFAGLSGAGVVAISSHGAINANNDVIILTSEPVTLLSRLAHFIDWVLLGRIEVCGNVWAIRPSFIKAYGSFPDSIVYASSCNSAANQTMANAFIGKGAKTYYGYSKVVNSNYSFNTGTALFTTLTDITKQPEQRTTQKAFDAIAVKTDPTAPNAVFTMFGSGDVALRSDLVVNGRFEVGNLTGWNTSGFGYTLAVTEDFSEGAYSARIGRWDQPYMAGGNFRGPPVPGAEPFGTDAISQDIDLPATATSLPFTFDYNIVTYDGADYDWLDVTVTDATTGAVLLRPINHVGGIIAGSTSNWGLFYTTGWRSVSADLTPYKGRKIRIAFSVQQDGFGDQIATYVDNVSIKCQ